MSRSEPGRPETQHEHGACQEVLGDIEAETGEAGGGGVVIPRLLGHHDQPEVDLEAEVRSVDSEGDLSLA